jgi:hypothetical protein
MKIPSYKYKLKQIFKKIGQPKAFDLFLMYSANFYFVVVLAGTMKVKNSPSLSDNRTVGPTGCRTIATLPVKTN